MSTSTRFEQLFYSVLIAMVATCLAIFLCGFMFMGLADMYMNGLQ